LRTPNGEPKKEVLFKRRERNPPKAALKSGDKGKAKI